MLSTHFDLNQLQQPKLENSHLTKWERNFDLGFMRASSAHSKPNLFMKFEIVKCLKFIGHESMQYFAFKKIEILIQLR